MKQGCPHPIQPSPRPPDHQARYHHDNKLDTIAYCDDIAMGFTQVTPVKQALKAIDNFNHASGMTSNADKTKYISTLYFRPPLNLDLPDRWKQITETKSYRYLGILMGKEININDVFMEAWDKLSRRVASYMPYKNYYNTQTRVIISNAFLSSIFSYLFRFYLIWGKTSSGTSKPSSPNGWSRPHGSDTITSQHARLKPG